MNKEYCFVLIINFTVCTLLIAQDKTLLSEAINSAIDTRGIEAANEQFAEQYESKKDFYEIDMMGISELSSSMLKMEILKLPEPS